MSSSIGSSWTCSQLPGNKKGRGKTPTNSTFSFKSCDRTHSAENLLEELLMNWFLTSSTSEMNKNYSEGCNGETGQGITDDVHLPVNVLVAACNYCY